MSPPSTSSTVPFVGRENECAALTARLDAALAGRGSVVLIAGEPGIGKTRLAEEVDALAQCRGAQTLWGRCYEGEGAPAFWPWSEVLRAARRADATDDPEGRLPTEFADLARLVTEAGEPAPTESAPWPTGPAQVRFRLFEAVNAFLRRQAARRPLVVVLDELHWADAPSLLLLAFIARTPLDVPLLVLALYREDEVRPEHPLAGALAELARRRSVTHLRLGRLTHADIARLVALMGAAEPPQVVAAIAAETEGNPFFVVEMVRLLLDRRAEDGAAPPAGDRLALPETVRHLVGRRVAGLSAACRRLLDVAAVAGREFDLAVLGRAAGLDTGALLLQVEEAERALVLVEAPDEPDRRQFAHALIHEALYATLSAARRNQLHRQLAEAIEARHHAYLIPHLAGLAAHYRLAGQAAPPEKAIEYAVAAGQAARDLLAWEEAVAHWKEADRLMAAHGVPPARRVRLLDRLGDLLFVTGLDHDQAIAHLETALRLAEATGDAPLEAGVHSRLARHLLNFPGAGNVPRALDHYRAAEAMLHLTPEDPELGAVLIGLAGAAHWALRSAEGRAASARALALAERPGSDALWANAAALHGYFLWSGGRLAEGCALQERAWERADASDDAVGATLAAWSRGDAALYLNAPQEGLTWYRRELAKRRQARVPVQHRTLLHSMGYAMAETGDLAAAERLRAEAGEVPFPFLDAHLAFRLGEWEAARDRWNAVHAHAGAAGDRLNEWWSGFWLARVEAALGEPNRAEARLGGLLAAVADGGPHVPFELRSRACLAVLATPGRPAAATEQLARCGAILANGEDWRGLAGWVEVGTALAAADEGRPDAAGAAFAAAIDIFHRHGSPWDEAEARERWARTLLAEGKRADAAEQVEAAAAVYAGIGAAQRWSARLHAILHGHAPPRAGTYPDGITAREVEVLLLLAAGRTNKQIADKLVLSVRTVERHIGTIYGKIGVTGKAGRAAAAAYALRHGLLGP